MTDSIDKDSEFIALFRRTAPHILNRENKYIEARIKLFYNLSSVKASRVVLTLLLESTEEWKRRLYKVFKAKLTGQPLHDYEVIITELKSYLKDLNQ